MRIPLLALTFAAAVQGMALAQSPPFERLTVDAFDVLPPSARVRGVPGSMAVVSRPCRVLPTGETRRRVVDVAVQEWGFFGFRIAAPRDGGDDNGGPRPVGEERDDANGDDRRRRRPRLAPAEAARVAATIAGYWAVTPEGAWIVGRQNERWKGEDGIAARWNAPWSAAFISWVMCEAGLGLPAQFARAVAHHTYIDQAIRARGNASADAAFTAYDVGEAVISPGDLLCASRRPAYRSIADRRRQLGVGARSHCDIVVKVDESAGRVLAIGGNVRGVVSLKAFPASRGPGGLLRPDTQDAERPLFAHLKLRAPQIDGKALETSRTVKASGCVLVFAAPAGADPVSACRPVSAGTR